MPRYLTKSRFKLGLECTAKLFYTKKPDYTDSKLEDTFLAALAEGGFQVGELAKIYIDGGHDIEELEYDIALEKTSKLLQAENVVIYEAAFLFNNLFIRADIIKKTGKTIELVEVKAKSFDRTQGFLTQKQTIRAGWQPYLFDIAFQHYVVSKAMPGHTIVSSLFLADKEAVASIDGLNQHFQIQKDGDRIKATATPGLTKQMTGQPVLVQVNVNAIVHEILDNKHYDIPFEQLIQQFSDAYEKDVFLPGNLGKQCGDCEFKADEKQIASGMKSGFHECWQKLANFQTQDFNKPSVLEVWNFKGKDECISNRRYFQSLLSKTDFDPKTKPSKNAPVPIGLTQAARKALQVEKNNTSDASIYLDKMEMKSLMDNCNYPLHFIDFETTTVALPFNKGRRPYEQTAFQFSHHIIQADGTVHHAGEWINMVAGKFPNFDFIRALKASLEKDNGTIFRYSHHENTVLNAIYNQLQSSDLADKAALSAFIQNISHSTKDSTLKWEGKRNMVDMYEWVLKFFYSPATKGSNSIKAVLPAMLQDSKFLQEKYSKPTYNSNNFTNKAWIELDENGQVINPYKRLPSIHEGFDNESMDTLVIDEEAGIFDGGAAMVAYAKMQFTQMGASEKTRIEQALLRYCELDTFAMVMIWEAWQQWCN